MSENYIIAIDQGTTSSRAILFDKKGHIKNVAQMEFAQIFPQSGWVEHDPELIWESQRKVLDEILAGLNDNQSIAAIGITNQRETAVVWDKKTGKPIYNAIVWQDRRTAAYCRELIQQGLEEKIQEKTGLVIDSYFSATKVKWILDHVDGAREKAAQGDLAFGTIDSYLIWKLTGGKVHITDVTNASRTMLYNIHTLAWDKELLELFDIPEAMLPEVKSCSEIYAHTSEEVIKRKIPIAGIAGDQQAALFGQLCTEPGMVKNTYGTGCFLLMNVGSKPILSKNKLLSTVAWKIGDRIDYALEGSVFIAGAVIQWLRDELKLIENAQETHEIASSVDSTAGVVFIPAFAGLGAPYWNPEARGTLLGLSRGSSKAHIVRAALESIAYQNYDVIEAMQADSSEQIKELRVDGGAANNNFLMQFQADLLACSVIRPKVTETTAMGAAFLAGLAVGYWKDIDEIKTLWEEDVTFQGQSSDGLKENLASWHKAIKAVENWTKS